VRPWPFSHCERVGGKSRLWEEPGALFPQAWLIVFDDEQIIRAAFLHQMARGVGLGMQRIGSDQCPGQRHLLRRVVQVVFAL